MVALSTAWIRDIVPYPIFVVILAVLLVLYLIEGRRHRAALARIPTRIHVNGTRGKSSVTRLIAAGMRAGGIATVAKTTGSAPRFIHRDGSEEPIRRRGSANIREQIWALDVAAREGAQAAVFECMAIRPDLQRISERKILFATHGVVTNVRPDHLDVMGPTLENVAMALALTTPRSGHLFTADTRFASHLRGEAQRRGSQFHLTTPDRYPTPEEMRSFDYIELPENVGLALDVCTELGIERATALRGMYDVTPDIGAARRMRIRRGEREIDFVNALAANDRESTAMLWRHLGMVDRSGGEAGILISNRADRLHRVTEMAQAIAADLDADWYVAAGAHAGTFIRLATRNGVPREKLHYMGDATPEDVLAKLFELTRRQATVMGIGNIGGFGHRFIEVLEKERAPHATAGHRAGTDR